MWFNRKAQAATEFAVLGSLIIMAFAFLINYSEQLNRKQANIQQTFRAALQTARAVGNLGSPGSYTKVAFRRMPNVGSPMELGQVQSFSDSANVFWGFLPDGPPTAAVHGVSIYQFNEALPIVIPYQTTPVNAMEESKNKFTNDVDATTTFVKTENGGTIKTTKTLSSSATPPGPLDSLTADVTISGTRYIFPTQYLGEQTVGGEKLGGKYYPGVRTISRSRKMQ